MRGLLTVFFGFLLSATAQSAPHVYLPGNGVITPRVLDRVAPDYTAEARLARLQGSVGVSVVVLEDGSVDSAYVTRSLGLGLDQEALEAVKQWLFAPGIKDGTPVAVLTQVDVRFRLLETRSDWHLSRVTFDDPAGVTAPEPILCDYPDDPGSEQNAEATVSFEIDENGAPVDARIEKSTDAKWQSEVIGMLHGWRFRPAMKDGKPVRVRCTLDFSRGPGASV